MNLITWSDEVQAPAPISELLLRIGEEPDPRPRSEEQEPHLLVIESIDWQDAHQSKLWVECPLDHHAARHWCLEDVYVTSRHTFKLVGALVYVNFRTLVDCWVMTDVENTGVLDMLGIPSYVRKPSPWPDDLPQQPGMYPVIWQCYGYGEDHTSWLEVV